MKISIVTPVLNGDAFIAETIHGVISQRGDFSIEYIIIDGESKDRTVEILSSFQQLLESGIYPIQCRGISFSFISEKDSGMYEAINKGFDRASGDIYAWINADDMYLPGAFSTISNVFQSFPEVHWVKGITSYIDQNSSIQHIGRCFLYNQEWLQQGVYGRDLYFIQQDSTFWRSHIWKRVGGIDSSLRLAGDYWLWTKMAQETPLYSLNAYLSCFRSSKDQLSKNFMGYLREIEHIFPQTDKRAVHIKKYFAYEEKLPMTLRKLLYRILFGRHTYRLLSIGSSAKISMDCGAYHDLLQKINRRR